LASRCVYSLFPSFLFFVFFFKGQSSIERNKRLSSSFILTGSCSCFLFLFLFPFPFFLLFESIRVLMCRCCCYLLSYISSSCFLFFASRLICLRLVYRLINDLRVNGGNMILLLVFAAFLILGRCFVGCHCVCLPMYSVVCLVWSRRYRVLTQRLCDISTLRSWFCDEVYLIQHISNSNDSIDP